MLAFSEAEAEHYGYAEELFSLNLLDCESADYAIKKWLLPESTGWSHVGRELRREAARVCIGQEAFFSDIWLPGLDERWKIGIDFETHLRDLMRFQRQVWEIIFGELFVAHSINDYARRVDKGFEQFPDFPNLWGEARYSKWPSTFTVS
jgi:hypothetical protein